MKRPLEYREPQILKLPGLLLSNFPSCQFCPLLYQIGFLNVIETWLQEIPVFSCLPHLLVPESKTLGIWNSRQNNTGGEEVDGGRAETRLGMSWFLLKLRIKYLGFSCAMLLLPTVEIFLKLKKKKIPQEGIILTCLDPTLSQATVTRRHGGMWTWWLLWESRVWDHRQEGQPHSQTKGVLYPGKREGGILSRGPHALLTSDVCYLLLSIGLWACTSGDHHRPGRMSCVHFYFHVLRIKFKPPPGPVGLLLLHWAAPARNFWVIFNWPCFSLRLISQLCESYLWNITYSTLSPYSLLQGPNSEFS